jgi:hypothetical protein
MLNQSGFCLFPPLRAFFLGQLFSLVLMTLNLITELTNLKEHKYD